MSQLIKDIIQGSYLGVKEIGPYILHNYFKVPIGIIITLMILYGVNEIILLTKINFPASVTCMLIIYLALVLCSKILGVQKTKKIVDIINIPGDFSLRWINIFFTPAFITLPLSQWISAREALTIAAIFVFGYFICTAVIAYFSIGLQRLLNKQRKSNVERGEELEILNDYDINGEIETSSLIEEIPNTIEQERFTSYQTYDDIPGDNENFIEQPFRNFIQAELKTNKSHQSLSLPSPTAHITRTGDSNNGVKLSINRLFCKRAVLEQSHSKNRRDVIKDFVSQKFNLIIFTILFIVSLPIYFAVNYEMFLQLSISIFTFLFILNLPLIPKYKKYFHPVLCSVCLSWFFYYLFALMKHENFLVSLAKYKTSRNYLRLFNHKTTDQWPGAGDIFSSLMDVSILSLSIPMYTYRNDLKRHFFVLFPTILLMTFSNFFIYPPLCYHLGISSERSLGYAGRSVTLALGTPFVQALDGSIPLMACTTVVSGIIGSLTCEFIFGPKCLKIKEDDYITRGATLGLNCGAIATAHLLTTDPRAAAMSSLSFVLFGTFMVVLASIVPLANIIKSWVGL
ncbi:hypothetical protein WICMUC_004915 [Wickerhamomyces mucosus]|uniref:LrgB-like protein n=1 Tax=Wickerhamomyces mucosus TaxID=1378264 RepID=A0A9P8PE10_9ASCO|nr:hypothetical protein WICMUC_004915 [Wickerhamomyces mucosus]